MEKHHPVCENLLQFKQRKLSRIRRDASLGKKFSNKQKNIMEVLRFFSTEFKNIIDPKYK